MYLSIRTGFLQIRKFPYAIRTTIGRMFRKKDASDGSMTPFQAVCTALAATVGTGNIAGVAGAIAIGRPGRHLLDVAFRRFRHVYQICRGDAGRPFPRAEQGGRPGRRSHVLHQKRPREKTGSGWLSSIPCFGVLTVFGTGNATQVNTITTAIDTALVQYGLIGPDGNLSMLNLVIGIFIAMLVAMVLLGGVKRIGSVTEKLVPFHGAFLCGHGTGRGVVLNIPHRSGGLSPPSSAAAFSPKAFTGGLVGSMFLSLKKGVSRGIFSNEAGLGTGSIAHACADTKKPVKQGMFGIFEVFADTFVICTLTALVILCSGVSIGYGKPAGAELTISGFTATYGGWFSIFTAVALCCFAFSTIIGWGLYGARCIEYLCSSEKVVRPFFVVYSFVSDPGCDRGSGTSVGYRRYLQRSDGDSEPYRTFPSFRYGSETVEGFF